MEKMHKLSVLMFVFIFCGILTVNAQCDKEYTLPLGSVLQVHVRELFKMDWTEPVVFSVTKNGENIPLNDGLLYIPNLQFSDAGIYVFTAKTPTKVLYRYVCVTVVSRDRGLYNPFGNLLTPLKKLIDRILF